MAAIALGPARAGVSGDTGSADAAGASAEEVVPVYRVGDCLLDPAITGRLDAAPSWGDAALTLDIPGGPYAFTGLDLVSRDRLIQRFAPAVAVSPRALPGSLLTRVCRIDPGVFRPPADPRFAFELAQSNGSDGIDLAGWRLAAHLSLPGEPGGSPGGYLAVARAADLLDMGDLENYLRFLVAYALLLQGGLLMHSACVAYQGEAYLFVGRSGAGKTTIAAQALETGLELLSDDMNALTPGNPPRVHKLPFAGTLGERITDTASYPLRAVCWLRQGLAPSCAAMSPAQALARLAACCPYVNIDPYRAGRLLESLEALGRQLPLLTLTFPRQVDVVEILKLIGGRSPVLD